MAIIGMHHDRTSRYQLHSAVFSKFRRGGTRAGDVMDRERLAEFVRRRRQDKGLSVRAAAKLAGIDRATWTALEDGSRATQDRHYGGIERALDWAPGSVETVGAGGEPRERDEAGPDLRDAVERDLWSLAETRGLGEKGAWLLINAYRADREPDPAEREPGRRQTG